jgi:hypothetical protein
MFMSDSQFSTPDNRPAVCIPLPVAWGKAACGLLGQLLCPSVEAVCSLPATRLTPLLCCFACR